jgi:hypothetical protein
MTLDYIPKIDGWILKLPKISDKAKMLLALIIKFDSSGMMTSNEKVANLLNCTSDYVGKLIKEISPFIKVENPQSRYRKIFYSGENNGVGTSYSAKMDGVDSDSTPSISTPTQHFSTPTPSKTTTIKKVNKEKHTCAPRNPLCEETFNGFWEAYPRKENKAAALREWKKLNPDTKLLMQIMFNVNQRSQTPDWLKENGRYVLSPKNYLRDHRWMDETPEVEDCGCVQTQDTDPEEAEQLRIAMLKAG